MNRILAIFRKDARHLWPQATLLILLMALSTALDPTYSRVRLSYYEFFAILLPVACWLVIVSAIHEEKLPGDRQYWLTRPYCWKELLAAKLLFIAAFVNLPLLVCHVAVCLAVGLPLAEQWLPLLWRQVFFTAFYILPAAALASITRTIGRMAAAGILVAAGGVFSRGAFEMLPRRPMMTMQPSGEVTAIVQAALLAVGISVILALQYARRRTGLATGLTAALAGALLLPALFSIATSSSSGRPALSLELDPERRSAVIPGLDANFATLEFPVRLSQVPEGVLLDRVRTEIRINDTARRRGLLRVLEGQLHDLQDGRGWLSVFADSTLLAGAGGRQVILSGAFDLRLFRAPRTLPIPRGHAVTVAAVGVCRDFVEEGGGIAFSCYSAMPRAAVLASASGAGVNWIVPPGSVSRSIPTDASFQPLTRFVSLLSYTNWQQVGAVRMVAAEPLPLVRVDFRLSLLCRVQ